MKSSMRFKPPTFLRKRKVRTMIAASTMLLAVSGMALAQSAPQAKADPQTQLVAVGSDTIQDIWSGLTNGQPASGSQTAVAPVLAVGLVASYNATNPASGAINEAITPQDGWAVQNNIIPNPGATHPLVAGDCSYSRPNGSGQGVAALRVANNATSTLGVASLAPTTNGTPGLGCVDIARSSSGVDTTDNNTATDMQWVPFAVDGVTGAQGPSAAACTGAPNTACPSFTADLGNGSTQSVQTVASTLGTDINTATLTQIISLYNCHPTLIGSTTYFPVGSSATFVTGDVNIDLYVPQSGSGTRKFWEGSTAANFPDSEVDATTNGCVHDFIVGGVLNNTTEGFKVPVEEHDGTAVSTDPIGYGPFSIAQYISQQNPVHNPRFHGAVLDDINNVAPFNTAGSPSSGLNTAGPFPVLRYVYDVVKLSRLTTAGDPIDTLFNGVGSIVCKAHSTILGYGFALMSANVLNGLSCGAISTASPDLEGSG